jgi:hypothetical protein
MSSHASHHGQHEREGSNVTAIVLSGVGILLFIVFGFIFVKCQLLVVHHFMSNREKPDYVEDVSHLPQRVLGWATPGVELAETRANEAKHLDGYAWIDQSAGVVRIPISRAMELVADSAPVARPEGRPQ